MKISFLRRRKKEEEIPEDWFEREPEPETEDEIVEEKPKLRIRAEREDEKPRFVKVRKALGILLLIFSILSLLVVLPDNQISLLLIIPLIVVLLDYLTLLDKYSKGYWLKRLKE